MTAQFGPRLTPSGTEFRLWAPSAPAVSLILQKSAPISLEKAEHGYWKVTAKDCGPGTRYKFRIGGLDFPDPASRQQDGGTAGWSIVCSPIPPSGRKEPLSPWNEALLCEVHVGTATPEGTFTALAGKLDHFRDAGYTTLEIMPINAFPGKRNWGYDGTLIFAPAEAYGTREELRALVDRAHELGICLVLDVVYNHFGEFDNFIEHYAPEWFDPDIDTPWGPGVDFRQEAVRQFYYENAMMWLSKFDFDGLRFDSVHEMKTECRDDFLTDLAAACRSVKSHAKLIIENMDNSASWLERKSDGDPKFFSAQWDDDIHHVLNFLVTGEPKNGYDDTSRDPIAELEKGLADGFIHDGEAGGESNGNTRNEPGSNLPPEAFVSYVQNHDQIGNRADSKRLPDRISAEKLDFLHFAVMLAPQVPLFFIGEEAHLRTPFPFFLDLPEKAAAFKRKDRYKQMREIFKEDVKDGDLPDPNDPATFQSAKIDWSEFDTERGQAGLARFRQLSGWRKQHLWPLTASTCLDAVSERQGNVVIVTWTFEAGRLTMALNPADSPATITKSFSGTTLTTGSVEQQDDRLNLGAWSAVVWVESGT